MTESHPHGKDTRTNTPIVRNLISNNGPACSVHDEPNVSLDTADFNIGFIGGKNIASFIIVMIDKGLDTDSGCFTIVGDLLMGDADVIKILERLRGFS